ncbi:uncharacterized protein [Apostichopus japonicus]|uniref:uncharacterized protein n=1 Tax=Stichopus japonicus TaxID=307972 RepID=UPI003AB4A657
MFTRNGTKHTCTMVAPIILSAWFFLLFVPSAVTSLQISCQKNIVIEKGHNATIGCNTSEPPTDVFWYIGPPSSTSPILALENNLKSGTLYDSNRFDITSNGHVIISNAQIEDEAVYTVVAFFATGNYEVENITVSVKVSPQQGCPLIAKCASCSNCTLQISQTGQLQCTVTESRPKVLLRLEIRRSEHLQFTTGESIPQKNEKLGTWNTSTSVEYTFDACGGFADIRCLAQDDINVLHRKDSNIRLTSESCNEDNTKPTSSSMKVILTCALTISGILTLSLAVFCYTLHRRHGGRKGTLLEEVKQKTLLEELTDISLINSYCSDCQYTITYTDNVISHVNNADDMIAALSKGEQGNRVLFVGEPGIGKSHLFRDISRKWRKGETFKDYILIYFQLENVLKDACILEELMKLLGLEMSAAEANRINLDLQSKKSIVMLDGISNWSRLHNSVTNDDKGKRLTIKQLLEGDVAEFSKMKIWVTSRNLDHDVKVMNTPYTRVDVVGFTESHRNLFFERFSQLTESKRDEKEEEVHVRLERKQREGKGKECDPEERPLNAKHSEDISSAWQTHMEDIIIDGCIDYLVRSPLIARLFASIYLNNFNEDNKPLADHLFRFSTEKKQTTETLVASGNCDLLACLLEVGTNDEEEYRKYANLLHMKELLFRHMTYDYYREAILHLLKTCKETQIEFTSLEIYGDSPIVQLRELPIIHDQLVFHGVHLASTDEFKAFMSMVQKKTKTITFHNSTVPERLSEDEVQDIGNFEVLRNNEDNAFERLFEDGEWREMTTATSEV